MCGIAGIYNTRNIKTDRIIDKLSMMNRMLAHRGPDDEGIWTNQGEFVGIAHRRLSIIDLSQQAHQPMVAQT